MTDAAPQAEAARQTEAAAWTAWPTRFVLFTGKGGVGKTTAAAALAVALADDGRRVLIVSTDPASNLGGVFEMAVGQEPTPVPGIERLDAMDIDPEAAADAYRTRVLDPLRGTVPDADLAAVAEQVAGQCTVEIAAFDQFSLLLGAPSTASTYDHVIFDTAPTGHTLRLLELPAAWTAYIDANPGGTGCLGPLSSLGDKQQLYRSTVDALADAEQTTVVLVARPEPGAVREAARAAAELAERSVANQRLIVNGVLAHPRPGDPVAEAFADAQGRALDHLPPELGPLPRVKIPLVPYDCTGLGALRALVGGIPPPEHPAPPAPLTRLPGIDDLARELIAAGPGVTMVMGKGGVGKTTVAAELAVALSEAGISTHLASTDPAGHLPETAGAGFTTSWVDPAAEGRRYAASKVAAATDLDDDQRALLEEDLRSPCTQELAVFVAFSDLLRRGRRQHVVIDTAPTGHTLLLLDQTGAYHRDVVRTGPQVGGRVITPLMRLQDPAFTRIIIVTLAQTTPIEEAAALQDDLRRAGIEPYGWVINASLAATDTADPVLRHRAQLEHAHIERVHRSLATRAWIVPWQRGDDRRRTDG